MQSLQDNMTIMGIFSTNEDTKVHSEEILNAIRKSDNIVMGTSEIAEQVGMSTKGVKNRLENLEAENRVVSQKIGSDRGFTYVWGLHPEERQTPVNPEIDRLVKWIDKVIDISKSMSLAGVIAIGVGSVIWFSVMTTMVLGSEMTAFFTQAHVVAYSAAAGGSVALAGGATVQLLSIAIIRIAEYLTTT